MASRILSVGLIGCGDIGALRAASIRRNPQFQLRAVSDLDTERQRKLADKFTAETSTSWQELIQRDDIDVVIVSTPPSVHAEMAILAMEHGKHVLCEKPLARSIEECQQMVDAAERCGCVLATGFNYRFYPSIQKARQLLDAGVIGELDHIRSYAGYSATEHSHPWMRDASTMGGGALRDNGIHLIDLTCYFLGDVVHGKGLATNSVWGFDGCEDNGFLLLQNARGSVATLQASWTEWRGYQLRIELYGELGCIRTWCFPMLTQCVTSAQRGGRTKSRWNIFPMTHVWEKLRSYRWVVLQSFITELNEMAKSIQGEPSHLATGLDGLHAVKAASLATESDRSPAADLFHA